MVSEREPKVVIGLWRLMAAVVSTVVLVVGLVAWLLETVRDDIAAIRLDVDAIEAKADSTILLENSKDGEVRSSLAELVTKLEVSSQRVETASIGLQDLSTSVAVLSKDVTDVRISLGQYETRRVQFETWVIGQLGAVPTDASRLPANWNAQNDAVRNLDLLTSDPLSRWRLGTVDGLPQ